MKEGWNYKYGIYGATFQFRDKKRVLLQIILEGFFSVIERTRKKQLNKQVPISLSLSLSLYSPIDPKTSH